MGTTELPFDVDNVDPATTGPQAASLPQAIGIGSMMHSHSAGFDPRLATAPYQRYREMTIDELLLENRVVFLVGEINYQTATGVIMRLLHLQNQKQDMDINLYINSHGGSVDDTLAVYDTMQHVGCDVATYCIGRAQSGGAMVLSAGTKGKRFILPHARVMIHQPSGGFQGQASDIEIHAREILALRQRLNEIYVEHTGRDLKTIEDAMERDNFLTPDQAKEFGLIDEVVTSRPKSESDEKKD